MSLQQTNYFILRLFYFLSVNSLASQWYSILKTRCLLHVSIISRDSSYDLSSESTPVSSVLTKEKPSILGMRPVRRIRRASHEVVEFMGQSVDNFSKIGKNYIISIISYYIKGRVCYEWKFILEYNEIFSLFVIINQL